MNLPTFFFKYRSYTPIALVIVLLYQANPEWRWIIVGLAFVLAGESIRFWAVLHAGGATRTRKVGASKLVTTGPYAYVRNPLYVGNYLIYIGMIFIAGGPWMWGLLVVALGFFAWQYSNIITLEEETLQNLFGDEYSEYKANVPRIIPRLTPWKREESADWQRLPVAKALKPEKSTLINISVMLVLIFAKWAIFLA